MFEACRLEFPTTKAMHMVFYCAGVDETFSRGIRDILQFVLEARPSDAPRLTETARAQATGDVQQLCQVTLITAPHTLLIEARHCMTLTPAFRRKRLRTCIL